MTTEIQEQTIKSNLENLKAQARELRKQLPRRAKKQSLPKSVRPEEFKKLIENTKKNNKEALLAFILAYGSGMRIAEIKSLKKENVHIDEKKILIISGKYNKDRVVPLPKGWKDWMINNLPINKSIRSLERNFKDAAKRANLNKGYNFHSLRHGFATRLL